MSAERRERYAAAMEECLTDGCDEPGQFAHAAMAVADEEKQEVAVRAARHYVEASASLRVENARLRAELEEVKTQHESFRMGATVGGQEMRRRLTEAEAAIARIRSRHVEYEGATVSAGSECGYCFESWPCGTVEIINGEAEGEQ